MRISNNLRKIILSLSEAKHRRNLGLFKVEGSKCVHDTISSFTLDSLICTESWFNDNRNIIAAGSSVTICDKDDLKRVTELVSPPPVIAIYKLPVRNNLPIFNDDLIIAIDGVQDPGNLGTIIRTADWFGIYNIICSKSTVDCFNPKVIQSTMGAISRVEVHYCDLVQTLTELKSEYNVYGTFMHGVSIYNEHYAKKSIVVMGNEGHGISKEISEVINEKLTIPSFSESEESSESLNVAMAMGIVVSEIKRQFCNQK